VHVEYWMSEGFAAAAGRFDPASAEIGQVEAGERRAEAARCSTADRRVKIRRERHALLATDQREVRGAR
jgi:hypothetical protein